VPVTTRREPHPERRPAVVTGASSGIGRATAEFLAAAGHPVVLGARRVDACREIADALSAQGVEAVAFPLDLSDPSSVEEFCTRAGDAFGPIEVVVSNAAQIWPGSAVDTDADAFEALLRVNVVGAHRLVRALAPGMIDRRRGDFVFVTSDVVARPRPAMAAYVASKWGLEGYVRALQMEWEGTGLRASIVRPGPTMTGMGVDWDPGATEEVLAEWVHWGLARHSSFLRPEGIAAAVLAVVSAEPGTHMSAVEVQPEAPVTGVSR
jgi:NAD(P)-dependent dehydrogenase (short-subunit alcohol dehydrogenase family)